MRRDTLDPGALGVLLGGALLYGATLAPGLGGTVDSAEFQQAAARLALVHPTGYPLYLLLGRAWIALLPLGEVAWRMNLLSAVFGVATLLVVYATVHRLGGGVVGGWAGATLAGTHALIWPTATVAEVTSLNNLLVAGSLYALLRWADPERPWPLEAPALIYGLALSHHRTSLLLAPAVALFVGWHIRKGRALGWAGAARCLGLLLLPWIAYLYLPLRASTVAWYSNNWEGFLTEVSGESAWPVIVETLRHPLLPRVAVVADVLFPEWPSTLSGALGLVGLLFWRRRVADVRRWTVPLLYGLSFLIICGVMVIYDVEVIGDYLALAVVLYAPWAGLAFSQALRWVKAIPRLWRGPVPVGGLLLAGELVATVLAQAADAYPVSDFHAYTAPRQFWTTLAGWDGTPDALPRDSILIGGWARVNELRYRQDVEGWRPDLVPVVLDDLIAGRMNLVGEWRQQGRAVYLIDQAPAVTEHYPADPHGPVWHVR